MLDYKSSLPIRDAIIATFPSADAMRGFIQLPLEDKVARIAQLCPETPDQIRRAALHTVLALCDPASDVAARRTQLGLPNPVSTWPIAGPAPQNLRELQDPKLLPEWADRGLAVTDACAQGLSYAELVHPRSKDLIAAAIRNHFGIGGLEDLGDHRAIQASDRTMMVLISQVRWLLAVQYRPEWFDAENNPLPALPAGVDARPYQDVLTELRQKEDEERKARQQARAAEYRTKKLGEHASLRAAALQVCAGNTFIASTAAAISGSFDAAKSVLAAEVIAIDDVLQPVLKSIILLPEFQSLTAKRGESAIDLEVRRYRVAAYMIWQAIMLVTAQAQPTWFRTLENGDLKLRPEPLKQAVRRNTRAQRAILVNLYKLTEKYGRDQVVELFQETILSGKSREDVLGADEATDANEGAAE